MGRIHEPMGTMLLAQRLRDQRPNRHLDALKRIHYCEAQFAVKDINVQDVFERGACAKPMRTVGVVVDLKRQRIARQTIVANEP